MRLLYLIPARAGSKGIPGKNIKILGGKPLVQYSLDTALQLSKHVNDICVSTDSQEIIKLAELMGINVHFTRPAHYATDEASSQDVILHAITYYKDYLKQTYDAVVLLQPTSPFRKRDDVLKMIELYTDEIDMVVSVKESEENPYYSLYEQDERGYLKQSKPGSYTRRQDCPEVYAMNGSVYIINTKSIEKKMMNDFEAVVKYKMSSLFSVDIDTKLDWELAEVILKNDLLEY